MYFSPSEIQARRLIAQLLASSDAQEINDRTPQSVARYMLCTQGQDYAGGLTALALRAGYTAKFESARSSAWDRFMISESGEQEIIRTWSQRGTLHFLHRDDWNVVKLMGSRALGKKETRAARFGQSPEDYDAIQNRIRSFIDSKTPCPVSRQEIRDALNLSSSEASHHLRVLGCQGIIAQGQRIGIHDSFFTSPWSTENFSPDHVVVEVVERYFSTRGPARLEDILWWSKLPKTSIVQALEALTSHDRLLQVFDENGSSMWLGPWQSDVTPAEIAATLEQEIWLPPFDEFMMSYTIRSEIFSPTCNPCEALTKNGISWPFVVANGQIQGRLTTSA